MTALNQNLDVIILAAGQGTRMKSATIKILHAAAGRPIIDYVLDLAGAICDRPPIIIIGHQRESVQKVVGERARYAVQEEQKGTGHAVLQAAPLVDGARHVLILSGDVPLTRPETNQCRTCPVSAADVPEPRRHMRCMLQRHPSSA